EDFPFCICWANENWTRRWDGSDDEILMSQDYRTGFDERFIRDILPILADRRYIRIDGAPLLLVYRPGLLPDPIACTETWRRIAREEGVGELHLGAIQSFGLTDPRPFGFDAAVEFPPHGFQTEKSGEAIAGLAEGFEGTVTDYPHLVQTMLRRKR